MRWLLAWRVVAGAVLLLPFPAFGGGGDIDWEEARQFWSFRAPVKPPLPEVSDESWVRNDIDRFILHRLEQEGLFPAAEANQETLARRLSFDLTGLPPSQRGVDRYLLDAGRDPYGDLVRSFLGSPRYGERFASLWMNVARYGEDNRDGRMQSYPGAHHYRRWVIDALNRDLPYDQFVRLQLAADFYGDDDLPALGFLALGPYPPEKATAEQQADVWADRVDTVTRGFLGLTVACARCHDHFYDPVTSEDYYAMAGIFASTKLDSVEADDGEAHVVSDGALRKLRLFTGGGAEISGPVVPRRNLRLFSHAASVREYSGSSGRRELADEITSPDNPLVARVMVNRVWAELFGRLLVATPSNFGRSGARPTHPELLDYLAVRFIEHDWSLKWLAREMVTSATYRQQAVDGSGEGVALYAGMKRRRLTAEMIRDAMLVVTDELTTRVEESADLDDPANLRRTVYGKVSRVELNAFLRQFDYPDPNAHAATRGTSITSAQKLFLLNSPFVQARAARIGSDLHGRDVSLGLDALYFQLFARLPTQAEREIAVRFFNGKQHPDNERWDKFAQVLLSSNQFLYRE